MRKEQEARRLKERFHLSQAAIAQALASDFVSSFFINIETGHYIEYSSSDFYRELGYPAVGDDFFAFTEGALINLVVPEDRDLLMQAFTKQNVTRVLSIDKSFLLSFRINAHGAPVYIEMKATKMIDDDKHIVVGFRNIDAHMKRIEEYEKARKTQLTFAGIAEALAADYVALFYVDTKDDVYREYYSTDRFKAFGIEPEGHNIFTGPDGIRPHVYKDDMPIFAAACNKQNILKVLSVDKSFALTLRLVLDDTPVYARIKISKMMLEDDYHVVIGITNVDDQVRREESYAKSLDEVREVAYRDPLTGVKSKHAYSDKETKMDKAIKDGTQSPFAALICDVNNLKKVNDTLGHKAGDQLIKDACALVCDTFAHSPVFRVGGDEFAVILEGHDYDNREDLLKGINAIIDKNHKEGSTSISIGMSVYNIEVDQSLRDVIERADQAMYQRKKSLKAERKD
ncbi:MAG: GGDEF domain-containing protein [Bacilli bacterium]|nr:GGDEF domain-containing protein [Bacilli bacterium]